MLSPRKTTVSPSRKAKSAGAAAANKKRETRGDIEDSGEKRRVKSEEERVFGLPIPDSSALSVFLCDLCAVSAANPLSPSGFSRQDLLHDLAVDIGQAEIAALEFEGQFQMVDAHQVQHRRVQVVNVHDVLGGVVAEFVGLAVADTRL